MGGGNHNHLLLLDVKIYFSFLLSSYKNTHVNFIETFFHFI
jgi:hypothetical protein